MTTTAAIVWCLISFVVGYWAGGMLCYFYGRDVERRAQREIRKQREEAIRKLWNGQVARWNEMNADRYRAPPKRRIPYTTRFEGEPTPMPELKRKRFDSGA